jgi:hypothetical protein
VPNVVVIEKSYEIPASTSAQGISSASDSLIFLSKQSNPRCVRLEDRARFIAASIIKDKYFVRLHRLRKHRFEG